MCVMQTAFDLMAAGIAVHIVADATSSRAAADRHVAFRRLEQSGAVLTTTEAVLFQLLRSKDHPQFKAVQNLIKTLPPDSGLQK